MVKKPNGKSNGDMKALAEQMSGLRNLIEQSNRDFQDQINDLRKRKGEEVGASRLIADQAYNPTSERLPEYSVVSNSAVEPFALAFTCAAILDPKVLSGEVSLCSVFLDKTLRLLRGKGGKLLGYAAEQAKEEARKESEQGGDNVPLGQGM